MPRYITQWVNHDSTDGDWLIPRTFDDFVKLLAESSGFLRRQPFALACPRIVLVMVLEAHEGKIVQVIVVVPAVEMRDLAWFDAEVTIETVA